MTDNHAQTPRAAQLDRQTDRLIEAIYELPLGGDWVQLQEALCEYWSRYTSSGSESRQRSLGLVERHLERVMALLERVPTSGSERLHERLYQIPMPACTLATDGTLLDLNETARRLFGWLPETGPGMSPGELHRARRAIRELERHGGRLESFQWQLPSGVEVQALVGRLGEPSATATTDEARYLAVLVSNAVPDDAVDVLAREYGLTVAEAQLCILLAGGQSLETVASERSVSRNTVRTQLARTFDKTGVNSQAGLVSLVLRTLFAAQQIESQSHPVPKLTAYVDPEVHGHPRFETIELPDGRRLGYFEYGDPDGHPAVYLHGSLTSGLFMERQASQMLGSGIRLLCVERGGVGESDPNPDPSAEAYADDVGVLLDALGLDRFAVIGRSMGSWDALALALKRHSQVSQVALISGRLPVGRAADHERHAHFARSLYRSIWNSSVVGNLMLRVMRLQLLTSGPQRFFDLNSMPAREAELAADPRFLKHARAIWLRSAVHGAGPVQAHLKLYQDPVSDPPWRDFALPVLLVHGDCDDTVPLDSVLAQTASFRNRRVVVMPGLGHALVHLAMPEVLHLMRDGLSENAADC